MKILYCIFIYMTSVERSQNEHLSNEQRTSMSTDQWMSICLTIRERASVGRPENEHLSNDQRTGICLAIRERASVQRSENEHQSKYQRTSICITIRERASVQRSENEQLSKVQRSSICLYWLAVLYQLMSSVCVARIILGLIMTAWRRVCRPI